MATRVTAIEVKGIMPELTLSDSLVDGFILTANGLINSVFGVSATEDPLIKEIEKWFSAHMIASTVSRMTVEEKLGDATVKYNPNKGEGLSSTPYGQMVLTLDITGKMIGLGKMAATIYAVKSFD